MMSKELKVGLIALITIVLLFIGVNYLKGLNVLNTSSYYYAQYKNIGGLQVGSSVQLNGFKVGMVTNIDLLVKDNQDLLVTISIDKDFDIPLNSVCKIVNQDLMGSKGISLILGDSDNLSEVGDTLLGNIEGSLQEEVNAQILPLKRKAEELISSVDSVMVIVTAVLNKDTRENLRNSLKSLNQTFALMSQTMEKVDSIIVKNDERFGKILLNLESITTNLEQSNGEISTILNNFSIISDSLARANMTKTLRNINQITSKINDGEGSISLLMKDDKLYDNFERSTRELAELIEDIKLHPHRYVNFSIIGGSKSYQAPKIKE